MLPPMGTDTYGLTLEREGDGLRATVAGERNVAR